MISHILDTNSVIAMLHRGNEAVLAKVAASVPGTIAVSAVVAHELYYGAYRSAKAEFNLQTLRLFFVDFPILDLDREDARCAGEIRAALAGQGTPIGPYDVLIAGQAKARHLVLVTNNTGEFSRVSDLQLDDWTSTGQQA